MTNAPTTRETADHAELARLAEAIRRAEHDAENAPTSMEKANARRALRNMQRFMGTKAPALLSEIAVLHGERDAMVEGLKDATTVHINMLRDGIAKPPPCNIGHLYRGDDAVSVVAEVKRQNPDAFPATQAERQRDELRKALETINDTCRDNIHSSEMLMSMPPKNAVAYAVGNIASQALANQGAE